jgi:hypothetical protein
MVKKLSVNTLYLAKVDVQSSKSRFNGTIQPFFDDKLRPA